METVTVRGCVLAYDDAGKQDHTPMVWGHGLSSSRSAEDQFPLVDSTVLRADRRVVRYDARGHGESGDLVDLSDGGWDRLALDQVALLDELGIDEVIVGGASMGAATALHAAPLLGRRLRALVLVIPPTAWETRSEQSRLYDAMADVIEARGVESVIAASANTPPPDPFLEVARAYKSRRAATLRQSDPRRLAAAYRGARGADFPPVEAVAAVEVPTLVLAWSGDPAHPVSTAERLGELMPDARVSIASSMGELVTWTDRVTEFLART